MLFFSSVVPSSPDLTPKIRRRKKETSHKNHLLNNSPFSSFFRFHIKFRVGRQRLRLEIFHPLLCAHWNYGPKLQGLRVQPSIFVKHSNIRTSPSRSIILIVKETSSWNISRFVMIIISSIPRSKRNTWKKSAQIAAQIPKKNTNVFSIFVVSFPPCLSGSLRRSSSNGPRWFLKMPHQWQAAAGSRSEGLHCWTRKWRPTQERFRKIMEYLEDSPVAILTCVQLGGSFWANDRTWEKNVR